MILHESLVATDKLNIYLALEKKRENEIQYFSMCTAIHSGSSRHTYAL